jgi:hypothetical protein
LLEDLLRSESHDVDRLSGQLSAAAEHLRLVHEAVGGVRAALAAADVALSGAAAAAELAAAMRGCGREGEGDGEGGEAAPPFASARLLQPAACALDLALAAATSEFERAVVQRLSSALRAAKQAALRRLFLCAGLCRAAAGSAASDS